MQNFLVSHWKMALRQPGQPGPFPQAVVESKTDPWWSGEVLLVERASLSRTCHWWSLNWCSMAEPSNWHLDEFRLLNMGIDILSGKKPTSFFGLEPTGLGHQSIPSYFCSTCLLVIPRFFGEIMGTPDPPTKIGGSMFHRLIFVGYRCSSEIPTWLKWFLLLHIRPSSSRIDR